jgi:hypothetical protein
MKRMIKALSLAACAAALTACPAAAGVTSKAELVPGPPANISPPEQPRTDDILEFNTGGEMDMPATLSGNASGWAYYFLHEYHFDEWTYPAARSLEFGFPTNTYTADPIAMPVEWVVEINGDGISSISNPYAHSWTRWGTFTPTGVNDTDPPGTYTVVDLIDQDIHLGLGDTMVWGYENAGLAGQVAYSGEETVGWFINYWDSDVPYGRTTLMQFRFEPAILPTQEASLSKIKSLY